MILVVQVRASVHVGPPSVRSCMWKYFESKHSVCLVLISCALCTQINPEGLVPSKVIYVNKGSKEKILPSSQPY